jgi:2-polyprenyl-3-methyl-5-hydroxy-6-metoxy-1,4-benzoquinol methylase
MLSPLSFEDLELPSYKQIAAEFEEIWNALRRQQRKLDLLLLSENPFNQSRLNMIALTAIGVPFDHTRFALGEERAIYLRNWSWAVVRKFLKWPMDIRNSSYDILASSRVWAPRYWEYPWAITNTKPQGGMKILDVGSGWSLFPMYLAKQGCLVAAVDSNLIQMSTISPFLAGLASAKVQYSVGDVTQLTIPDDSFDRVYCISVLEHLEEEKLDGQPINLHRRNLDVIAIGEMLRALKPGGLLAITVDWSENPENLRSFRLDDVVKRLVKPFRRNLVSRNIPAIEWDQYSLRLAQIWQKHYPFLTRAESRKPYFSSALGILMRK